MSPSYFCPVCYMHRLKLTEYCFYADIIYLCNSESLVFLLHQNVFRYYDAPNSPMSTSSGFERRSIYRKTSRLFSESFHFKASRFELQPIRVREKIFQVSSASMYFCVCVSFMYNRTFQVFNPNKVCRHFSCFCTLYIWCLCAGEGHSEVIFFVDDAAGRRAWPRHWGFTWCHRISFIFTVQLIFPWYKSGFVFPPNVPIPTNIHVSYQHTSTLHIIKTCLQHVFKTLLLSRLLPLWAGTSFPRSVPQEEKHSDCKLSLWLV